ncbi:MAG: hypothetical protein MUC35_02275 [Candidatus Margulisbacteria bacterium]|nr:hypothetical protein [Candidatus Margulisiibacteriota bacterium]
MLDLLVAGFILFFLLKNAGGLLKTVKNIVAVLVGLVIYVVIVRLLLDSAVVSGEARKTLEGSYFANLATVMIKVAYPAVESGAPSVNSFIKDKLIAAPTKEVTVPSVKIKIPNDKIPNFDR